MTARAAGPLRAPVRDCLVLLLLAVVPALLTLWLHPRRPAWTKPAVPQLELAEITRWPTPVLWVDARETPAYAKEHIPGAVSLNETEWERLLPGFLAAWHPNARVVIYCDSQACNASEEVALRLQRELNLSEISVLKGGWASWKTRRR